MDNPKGNLFTATGAVAKVPSKITDTRKASKELLRACGVLLDLGHQDLADAVFQVRLDHFINLHLHEV